MNPAYRTAAPVERKNLAETARGMDCFATFCRCLASIGLEDRLRAEGPLTVFAPTEAAFDNLPPGMLATLMADADRLRDVLQYHIVRGACELEGLRQYKLVTLQGTAVTIGATDDGLTVDHANAIGRPVACGNGMLQPVDALLIPDYAPELSTAALNDSPWTGRPIPRPRRAHG